MNDLSMAPCRAEPSHGEIKRALELFSASPAFRAAYQEDAKAALRPYGLAHLGHGILSPLLPGGAGIDHAHPAIQAFWTRSQEMAPRLSAIKSACVPEHPRFQRWHRRQAARSRLELGAALDAAIIHTPFAAELAVGCSVGCWYCSLDAAPLQGVFAGTDANRALWREILSSLGELGPEAMAWGSVYWATEPLDNPDFELFCEDFHGVLGRFPQVTTAVAHRHIERVRELLRRSEALGGTGLRFSVNTLGAMERIMAAFSADELATTELLFQNRESGRVKAAAGRGLTQFVERPVALQRELLKLETLAKLQGLDATQAPADSRGAGETTGLARLPASNACVTGFLVNPVAGRLQLISPCGASERWPKGYRVFREERFASGEEFRAALSTLVAGMVVDLPEDRPLKLAPYLRYVRDSRGEPGGGQLISPTECFPVASAEAPAPFLDTLFHLLAAGRSTVAALSLQCSYTHGVSDGLTRRTLDALMQQGVLDEDCLTEPVSVSGG